MTKDEEFEKRYGKGDSFHFEAYKPRLNISKGEKSGPIRSAVFFDEKLIFLDENIAEVFLQPLEAIFPSESVCSPSVPAERAVDGRRCLSVSFVQHTTVFVDFVGVDPLYAEKVASDFYGWLEGCRRKRQGEPI